MYNRKSWRQLRGTRSCCPPPPPSTPSHRPTSSTSTPSSPWMRTARLSCGTRDHIQWKLRQSDITSWMTDSLCVQCVPQNFHWILSCSMVTTSSSPALRTSPRTSSRSTSLDFLVLMRQQSYLFHDVNTCVFIFLTDTKWAKDNK